MSHMMNYAEAFRRIDDIVEELGDDIDPFVQKKLDDLKGILKRGQDSFLEVLRVKTSVHHFEKSLLAHPTPGYRRNLL